MAYATTTDVQERMLRTMTESELSLCSTLLDDAAVLIDAYGTTAGADAKKVVSCRMVIRAMGDDGMDGIPLGATQGSMSALGYSQSWTLSNGSVGELYIAKAEKRMLGIGDRIGSHSPVEDLVGAVE